MNSDGKPTLREITKLNNYLNSYHQEKISSWARRDDDHTSRLPHDYYRLKSGLVKLNFNNMYSLDDIQKNPRQEIEDIIDSLAGEWSNLDREYISKDFKRRKYKSIPNYDRGNQTSIYHESATCQRNNKVDEFKLLTHNNVIIPYGLDITNIDGMNIDKLCDCMISNIIPKERQREYYLKLKEIFLRVPDVKSYNTIHSCNPLNLRSLNYLCKSYANSNSNTDNGYYASNYNNYNDNINSYSLKRKRKYIYKDQMRSNHARDNNESCMSSTYNSNDDNGVNGVSVEDDGNNNDGTNMSDCTNNDVIDDNDLIITIEIKRSKSKVCDQIVEILASQSLDDLKNIMYCPFNQYIPLSSNTRSDNIFNNSQLSSKNDIAVSYMYIESIIYFDNSRIQLSAYHSDVNNLPYNVIDLIKYLSSPKSANNTHGSQNSNNVSYYNSITRESMSNGTIIDNNSVKNSFRSDTILSACATNHNSVYKTGTYTDNSQLSKLKHSQAIDNTSNGSNIHTININTMCTDDNTNANISISNADHMTFDDNNSTVNTYTNGNSNHSRDDGNSDNILVTSIYPTTTNEDIQSTTECSHNNVQINSEMSLSKAIITDDWRSVLNIAAANAMNVKRKRKKSESSSHDMSTLNITNNIKKESIHVRQNGIRSHTKKEPTKSSRKKKVNILENYRNTVMDTCAGDGIPLTNSTINSITPNTQDCNQYSECDKDSIQCRMNDKYLKMVKNKERSSILQNQLEKVKQIIYEESLVQERTFLTSSNTRSTYSPVSSSSRQDSGNLMSSAGSRMKYGNDVNIHDVTPNNTENKGYDNIKVLDMFSSLNDIYLQYNTNYLYCHYGCCEHILTITNIRSYHKAIDHMKRSDYPHNMYNSRALRVIICEICRKFESKYVTFQDRLCDHSPTYFCE